MADLTALPSTSRASSGRAGSARYSRTMFASAASMGVAIATSEGETRDHAKSSRAPMCRDHDHRRYDTNAHRHLVTRALFPHASGYFNFASST